MSVTRHAVKLADCFVDFATPTETNASAARATRPPAITVMRVLLTLPSLGDGYQELGRGLYGSCWRRATRAVPAMGPAALYEALEVGRCDEHRARLRALVRRDDAPPL